MAYSSTIEELNMRHAIIDSHATKLNDILRKLSRERLNRMAGDYRVAGRSKMNKEALAEALCDSILDKDRMRKTLLSITSEEDKLVNRLAEAECVQGPSLIPGSYLYLMDNGLLYSFYDQESLVYVIPEDIKNPYREIWKQPSFREEWNRRNIVLRYIEAAVHLYGICPMDKLIEIYNEQQDRPITEREMFRMLIDLLDRPSSWSFSQNCFISDYFEDSLDEQVALLRRTEGKPYYIPEQAELLRYSSSDYFEKTPQLERLKSYILRKLCKDATIAEYVVDDIQLACSMEAPLKDIIYELERRDILFSSMEQAKDVVALIVDVYNHTVMVQSRLHAG